MKEMDQLEKDGDRISVSRWSPNPSPTRPILEYSSNEDEKMKNIIMSSAACASTNSTTFSSSNSSFMKYSFPFSISTRFDVHDLEEEATAGGCAGTRVVLTWMNVSVTVPSRAAGRGTVDVGKKRAIILQGINGYAEPGEVLAGMGPSGCRKSTLLDALAGRLKSNARQTGEILINGRKQALAYGTSAYVTQDDTLMATLTVKEAIYYSAELQLPSSMSRTQKLERADMAIREMGLQDAMNTRIGGWNVRGISGGQKRRVSICIEILTRPRLLFLDEPTSGLDSAASYHVMRRIITLANKDNMAVVASVHQPSSQAFELFHNLCLLSYGKLVYFGLAIAANEFFASSGFQCPSYRNPSDHFLRIINNDFEQEVEQGLEEGKTISTEETINILVKSYQSSNTYEQVQQRICHTDNLNAKESAPLVTNGGKRSSILQSIVLTRRSFVNMYRDLGYYWLRLAIYIALCLCAGTIFHDIG